MPYLTPDIVLGSACRALIFPDDSTWVAIIQGALETLTAPYNFEKFGTATVQQTINEFRDMADRFAYKLGTCRMIGEIIEFAGSASPDPKWLICDGRSLVRADYPDLFAVIGTLYGSVDAFHFNIPDLRDRTSVGAGSTHAIGSAFGEATHTLTVTEIPGHSHSDLGHTHAEGTAAASAILVGVGAPFPSALPSVGVTDVGNANIANTGGDGPHNNEQPSLAILKLIVAL
jgi:microcystin-dependent protein